MCTQHADTRPVCHTVHLAAHEAAGCMGFELLVVVGTVFMLPFVTAGFVLFWTVNHHDRASLETTWEAYAARRTREFVPARGEWPNRTSPSVRWRADELRFALSVNGREATARTRLVVWPRERLVGRFVIRARARAPVSDDGLLGRAFDVRERPRGLAARVFDENARRALLGFWQRDDVDLHYERGQLRLEWPGRESNDARIDEAERVLGVLARSLERAVAPPCASEAPP